MQSVCLSPILDVDDTSEFWSSLLKLLECLREIFEGVSFNGGVDIMIYGELEHFLDISGATND